MRRILLTADQQRAAAFLANQNDCGFLPSFINVEQYAVFPEQPEYALRGRVGPQRFHAPAFLQGVGRQAGFGFNQQNTPILAAESSQVLKHRFLE